VIPPTVQILTGDALTVLKTLPNESVRCCITSPPYWCLRSYGDDPRELGQEASPDGYVANLVTVLEEVQRVLAVSGTLWLVIGDSYAVSGMGGDPTESKFRKQATNAGSLIAGRKCPIGFKPKDLVGIPWLVAFALRNVGWYLREDIIWHKANCMPESVRDRCTRSHEYIFHFSKSAHYYHDGDAIKEPCVYDVDATGTAARKARQHEGNKLLPSAERNGIRPAGYKDMRKFAGKNGHRDKQRGHSRRHQGCNDRWDKMEREEQCTGMRNKRSVWRVAPAQYREAHFATFPTALIEPMILASTKPGETILDCFGGSGTVGETALKHGRSAILIDLYKKHEYMAKRRCCA
jgi:DNA modification methylase